MNASQIYIIMSVSILIIVAVLVFFISRRKKDVALPPMTMLAFGFILTGILYSNDTLLNYSLMGIGVTLAVVDMVRKIRTKKPK